MKRIALAFVLVAELTFNICASPTVSDVTACQRYPWNGLVDIDYTIEGDATNYVLTFKVTDERTGQTITPTKFLEEPPKTEGRHRVTWSMSEEGISIVSPNVTMDVRCERRNPILGSAPYYVIDLSAGPMAERYSVTTLSEEPASGWTEEYKTTKLVLRRIEAGADPLGRYTLTKPFYIGIFELTQRQWELVMGKNPSDFLGETRPVERVSYNAIRGDSYKTGTDWPESDSVDDESFVGRLRIRTGLKVDLPTVAQLEYACRAGTMSDYNNGGSSESDLRMLGRYKGNQNDGKGGYSEHTTVGSYGPNRWGLYDTHGNVWEWCLEWGGDDAIGTSPVTATKPTWGRCLHGGDWAANVDDCASSDWTFYDSYETLGWVYENGEPVQGAYRYFGFRLAGSAEADDEVAEESPSQGSQISEVFLDSRAGESGVLFVECYRLPIQWSNQWGEPGALEGDLVTVTADDVTLLQKSGEGAQIWYPSSVEQPITLKHQVGDTVLTKQVAFPRIIEAGEVEQGTAIIPEGVTEIAPEAFENRTDLTSVTIPSGVTTIGEGAFDFCSKLTTVTLPESLTVSSMEKVFSNCEGLQTIISYGAPITLDLKNRPKTLYYTVKYAKEWEDYLATLSSFYQPGRAICMGSKVTVVPVFSGGGVTSFKKEIFAWGESVVIEASPGEGFVFLGWSSDVEGIEGTESTLTFTMPEESVTLVANFFPKALVKGWIDAAVEAKIDGTTLLTPEQAEKKTEETINEKVASGDLVKAEDVPEKVQAAIDEKVENKELITSESLQLMAMEEPFIEVKDGKAKVGISLQTTPTLEEPWKMTTVESATVEDGKVRVVVPVNEKAAFYRFVVPEGKTPAVSIK